jgi:hypothetical protein
MSMHGSVFSRNPNICASCSSLIDGMREDTQLPGALDAGRLKGSAEPNPEVDQNFQEHSASGVLSISA